MMATCASSYDIGAAAMTLTRASMTGCRVTITITRGVTIVLGGVTKQGTITNINTIGMTWLGQLLLLKACQLGGHSNYDADWGTMTSKKNIGICMTRSGQL